MFLLRNVLVVAISMTFTCMALNANYDDNDDANRDILSLTSNVRVREKRGVDVSLLLRNLLLTSAQASDFKAGLTRAKVQASAPRPRPTTTRRPPTTRPPPPPPTPFNLFSFKNKFLPFRPIDYGDYDTMPQTPVPRPRPRPRPATTMAPPPTTTTAAAPLAPPAPPRPRPTPRRRPLPAPLRNTPIHRFGNQAYNQPFGSDYDYYKYPNQGLGGDYDYEDDDQQPLPPPPPKRLPNRPAAMPRQRPATAPPPPPPPPAPTMAPRRTTTLAPPPPPPVAPRRPPARLRNRVLYQYAQPADPFYDDIDPNDAQDDDIDYADVATADENNTANPDNSNADVADAEVPSDLEADPPSDAESASDPEPPNDALDYADDTNGAPNGADEAIADVQTTAQLPQIYSPRQRQQQPQQQQQQVFYPTGFNVDISGGVGSSPLSNTPSRGTYEFRNQFANFKTSFDGGYSQPSYNDGQYYSYVK